MADDRVGSGGDQLMVRRYGGVDAPVAAQVLHGIESEEYRECDKRHRDPA